LITSYTQILKDTSIPSSDKVQIIKDLSRAIANITDQINILLPRLPTSKQPESKEVKEAARKEEIKQIKKEKKELQPKTIPVSAEQGEWKMQ
jgi:hypothetical protein